MPGSILSIHRYGEPTGASARAQATLAEHYRDRYTAPKSRSNKITSSSRFHHKIINH